MKFFGIVCEFNPFHRGHKHLIEQTKLKTGTNGIVCAMSGSMVQRGDVAIFDKWQRAKAAVENGADLVIEIPVSYVLQSAEIYARGAVSLLSQLGCNGIAFGSEYEDTDMLKKLAYLRSNEPPEYKNALKDALSKGLGYPRACQQAVNAILGDVPKEAFEPNATLGSLYMSSCLAIGKPMEFHVEKRQGSYHDTRLNGELSSASAIRQNILSGDKSCQYSLCTSDDIYDINEISDFILGFFRIADEKKLAKISGMEEGLSSRLIAMSRESVTFNEFVDACVTKRYTRHRIRRSILCSILGIKDIPNPQYARVLALNSTGAEILREAKKNSPLEIITKITNSSMKNSPMLNKDILSTDIASLCCHKKASMDYTKSPIVIN